MKLPLLCIAFAALSASGQAAFAQGQKADPKDMAAIEACLQEARGKKQGEEICIGALSGPCLEQSGVQTTAGSAACLSRELRVWDDMLNAAHEQLRKRLDEMKWARLQVGQKAWLEARKLACEFYWEFFRGTAARPMAERCYLRETGNRALYLRFFLETTKK